MERGNVIVVEGFGVVDLAGGLDASWEGCLMMG